MPVRAVTPIAGGEVKTVGLLHMAGGNVKCDGCLERSDSVPGNLPHRNKGPNEERLT